MSNEILLKASGLTRRYGDREALLGVDLELRRGEVLGLLGPNGAGKSTTLRILSGCLPPTSGHVEVDGVDLLEQPLRAKRALGFLPEQPPLYGDMKVDAYLRYCAQLRGIDSARPAAAEAIDRCGLAEVRGRVIANLSKGYRQRVGIAQAIVHRPAVVILDEPTVALDPVQLQDIRALIRELGRDHGVILSTHLLPEVQSLCARVVILNRGRAVYSGELEPRGDRLEVIAVCSRPPAQTPLLQIPGVRAVEMLDPTRLRIELADEAAVEGVQRALLAQGCGLQEWWPARENLEQMFLALAHGEAA